MLINIPSFPSFEYFKYQQSLARQPEAGLLSQPL
jgi:hypothetical protein